MKEKLNVLRLKELCIHVWSQFTLDEREMYYCGLGTIEFVYSIANVLFMDTEELTDEALDEILDELGEPDDEDI